MTLSRTSSKARLLPGILGAVLVSVGAALIVGFFLGVVVGIGVAAAAAGVFLLLADRQIP